MDVVEQDRGRQDAAAQAAGSGAAPAGADFDVDGACAFVCAQASWLDLGLRRSNDPTVLATALRSHEQGHETWIRLISSAERSGASGAAVQLGALYAFHGRLIGALEGGTGGGVDALACDDVRRLLCDRLGRLTRESLEVLRAPGLDAAPTRYAARTAIALP